MIVKNHQYQCEKCHKVYMFEVDKPFSTVCPDCNIEMKYYETFPQILKRSAVRAVYFRYLFLD